ncbi:ORF2b [Alphamesonivirus casuarinaense]|uniref:ORF2b n=1 Tax=Alphamesonivirus casuarinaense TaxID=1945562 RepID=M4JU06_9NIDO|nr:ORF2b [Alphamesonivirus 4]AGE00065.1 ORF2b [Alphamesonivirus 4]
MSSSVSQNTAKTSTPKQGKQNNTNNGTNKPPMPQRRNPNRNTRNTQQPNAGSSVRPQQNRTTGQTRVGQTSNKPPTNQKTKKAVATGPNYTETDGKRYKIGKEFDARNHMGWRRNEKTGSSVQFLFKPKMASRIDQVYYRSQSEDADHCIHTFGVGVFVQDSSLERNAILKHTTLSEEEKGEYLRKLSDAFNTILLRTRNAFQTATQPALTVDA